MGKFTIYDINTQWNAILADFRNFYPMAGAYLEGTTTLKGSFESSPFSLTVRFPNVVKHHFEFFHTDQKNKASLQEYLEIALNRKVQLKLFLDEKANEEELRAYKAASTAGNLDHAWQMDQEAQPILKKLTEIFKTEFRGTRKHTPKGETL